MVEEPIKIMNLYYSMIECILNKDSRAGSIKSYALQYHTPLF